MNKYQIREYKDGEWDVVYHSNDGYIFGSPGTFDSRLDAIALLKNLEKTNLNPDKEFLSEWLLIDKD